MITLNSVLFRVCKTEESGGDKLLNPDQHALIFGGPFGKTFLIKDCLKLVTSKRVLIVADYPYEYHECCKKKDIIVKGPGRNSYLKTQWLKEAIYDLPDLLIIDEVRANDVLIYIRLFKMTKVWAVIAGTANSFSPFQPLRRILFNAGVIEVDQYIKEFEKVKKEIKIIYLAQKGCVLQYIGDKFIPGKEVLPQFQL